MTMTTEERAELYAESRRLIEVADAMLAERHPPLENVIPFTPKPPPEPEPHRLTAVEEMARDTAEQLDEFRDYISSELCSLLTSTFGRTADAIDELHEIVGQQRKFLEGDVADLKAEVASMRAEVDQMHSLVEHLVNAVAGLRDQVEMFDERGGSKVVSIRGSS